MKEGWEYKRFDELMSPAKVERCGNRDDLPVLSITMRGGIVKQSERFNKAIASVNTSNYKVVKDGQLVIAFPIDEGLLYTQDVAPEGIMSPAYNIWDVDYSTIDRRFLVSYFHSRFAFSYYKAKLRGSTQRRRSMDKVDLLSMPIPVPSLDIQQKIVAELDLLSGVIEKQKAQLEELDKLAQSIFYDMFGDPVTNEKGWEGKSLGSLCKSMVRGPFGSALKKEFFVDKADTTYKIYEQKHAIQKSAKIGDYYITKEKYEELKRFEVFPGDIIMSCSGTIGELFVIPIDSEKGVMNQALLKFTLNKNLIREEYFLYVMKYVKDSFTVHGTGLQNIGSVKIIKTLLVSLPPLSLQQEFAAKVEAIEAMKAKVRQSLKEAETLFNSRMDYYFN